MMIESTSGFTNEALVGVVVVWAKTVGFFFFFLIYKNRLLFPAFYPTLFGVFSISLVHLIRFIFPVWFNVFLLFFFCVCVSFFLVGIVGMGGASLSVSLFVASSERGRAGGCGSRDTSAARRGGRGSGAGRNLDARAGRCGAGGSLLAAGRRRNDANVGIQASELAAGSALNVVPPACVIFYQNHSITSAQLITCIN